MSKLSSRAVGAVLFATILLMVSFHHHVFDGSDAQTSSTTRRLFFQSGRHFEFPGKRVVNTSTPSLYATLKRQVAKRLVHYNSTMDLAVADIPSAVDEVQKELDWDTSTNNFKNLSTIQETMPSLNNFHFRLNHDKTISEVAKKRLEEYVTYEYAHLEDHTINSMFDIVVVTGNTSTDMNFLERWKSAIEHIHVIIIQQGDPHRFVTVPSWLDYELYTSIDVEKAVGKEAAWIFDLDSDGPAAANFGFIVADRQFVYFLDKDCVPIDESQQNTDTESGSSSGSGMGQKVKLSGLFRSHANNLMRPTAPYYYNNRDPYSTIDKQSSTSDYVRGYPYSLREGVQTAISYGSVRRGRDIDALTRLMKPDGVVPADDRAATGEGSAGDGRVNRMNNEMITTVPYGTLFSLSLRNVAVNRRLFGQAFCLLGAAHSKADYNIRANYEIVAGWAMKKIADHIGVGVKHLTSPLYLELRSVDESSEAARGELFKDMKADLLWLNNHEEVVKWFSSVELGGKSRDDPGAAVHELASKIRDELHTVHPVFTYIANIMAEYAKLFNQKNGFAATYLPISSRSSNAPPKDSPHKCAAFTIVHNETVMMEVWLRYYGKHLPGAVWLLNHHSGKDENANKLRLGTLGKTTVVPKVEELHGDKAGFPMGFLIGMADMYQRRFFRYGYKCVLLSDVDEIMIPDPDKYPGGLSQYLAAFVNNSEAKIFRAVGHIIAHISQADGDENTRLEPPIDWTQSIMGQRNFYFPQPKYSKPLVSKVPVHYKPGFHTAFSPTNIQCDEDLLLFHLREVDKEFCLNREYQKYLIMRNAHQSDLDKALNGHINNFPDMVKKGETCQFGMGTYYRKHNGAFDNTGKARLNELAEKWRKVEV